MLCLEARRQIFDSLTQTDRRQIMPVSQTLGTQPATEPARAQEIDYERQTPQIPFILVLAIRSPPPLPSCKVEKALLPCRLAQPHLVSLTDHERAKYCDDLFVAKYLCLLEARRIPNLEISRPSD